MTQTNTIRSTVFINKSWYQDDVPAENAKAGDPRPLSISWREAVQQADGTFLMKAFMQKAGEKATDITNNVYWRGNILQSAEEVKKDFESWEHLERSGEKEIYNGDINTEIVLTEAQIQANKHPSEKPPSLYANVYTGELAEPLNI